MYLTSFVKSLPVIFISLIVGWSYYAYVFAVVITAMVNNMVEQVLCAIVFHCLAIMFVWSYYMVVFTPAGSVPQSWRLSKADVDKLAQAQSEEEWKNILSSLATQLACTVKQRSVQNAVRYCEKCLCIKPDRSHHCSVCEDCTLKMDHHCPWVNNCVGFHNYKFFLLFLFYALSYCVFIAATTARYFLHIWLLEKEADQELGSAKYHILFVFFVSILFSLSVSSLFWYHLWLVLHNRSTLEQFRAPVFENNVSDTNGWSLGKLNNVREVFGPSVLLWLLPLQTCMGDGITFPTRLPLDYTNYHSIGHTLTTSRPETPSRTLINPVLGGQVTTGDTTRVTTGDTTRVTTGDTTTTTRTQSTAPSCTVSGLSGSLSTDFRSQHSPDCKVTITPDSGVTMCDKVAVISEVRLDNNGHAKTVMVAESDHQTEQPAR
jgi:palmitoyltransferase